jgi:hypothetical protein
MTVAAGRSTIPLRRPRLQPAEPGRADGWTGERWREGLRVWTSEVVACKRLIAVSMACIAVGLGFDYACGMYVHTMTGVKVPDLILDLFPAMDLSFLFIYGYVSLIAAMFLYPIIFRMRMIHVVAFQFSLLLVIRSLFMIFTHLETPAGAVSVNYPWFFRSLYFENDMFFSGHTAMTFLGFYVFRRSWLRYVFLVGAIVMAIVVLAMHVHYSIDVLAAFFMTYGSYRIGHRVLLRLDPAYRG